MMIVPVFERVTKMHSLTAADCSAQS